MASGEPLRLTREQVRSIDKLSIERYHIPGIVLMENAARAVTEVTWKVLEKYSMRDVMVLCGGGNNGGDALAVARHLHNRGANVLVALYADPARYTGDALTNWRIVQTMGLRVAPLTTQLIWDRGPSVAYVDGIFGTGLTAPPRDPFSQVADTIALAGAEVVAVDVPSGLDCDTGEPLSACIGATSTVTFVAEKVGFANPASKQYTGEITVGDIGCPRELIEEVARMPTT